MKCASFITKGGRVKVRRSFTFSPRMHITRSSIHELLLYRCKFCKRTIKKSNRASMPDGLTQRICQKKSLKYEEYTRNIQRPLQEFLMGRNQKSACSRSYFFNFCKILKKTLLCSNSARSITQFPVVEQALNLEL